MAHPKKEIIEYAMQFDFSITNNEAKYEALIARLKIMKELGVGHLPIFSNS